MAQVDYSSAAGDAYHAERHREFLESPLLTQAMSEFVRLTYFANLKAGETVLEIGAGLGTNLLAIKDFAKVTAVEPSPMARAHCEKLGISALPSIQDLPATARFDYVLLRHVLEHVSEPHKMLAEIKPLLAPGGTLIVALPIEPVQAPPNPRDIDHHLFSWTRQTIHNLLQDCGYRGIETRLNYRNGRKLLLPLYRMFGSAAYVRGLQMLGRVRGLSEIVVTARA